MRLEGGLPQPGSLVDADGPRVVVENGDHRVSSALAATATVEQRDRLAFHAIAGSARLERTGETVLRAPRVEVTGDARRPLTGYSVVGAAPGRRFAGHRGPRCARPRAEYIPRSARVTLAGGRAHAAVSAEAWADEGRAKGRASMQATDLDVSAGDVHMTGVMAARGRGRVARLAYGRVEHPEASVTVDSRVVIAPQSSAGSQGAGGGRARRRRDARLRRSRSHGRHLGLGSAHAQHGRLRRARPFLRRGRVAGGRDGASGPAAPSGLRFARREGRDALARGGARPRAGAVPRPARYSATAGVRASLGGRAARRAQRHGGPGRPARTFTASSRPAVATTSAPSSSRAARSASASGSIPPAPTSTSSA